MARRVIVTGGAGYIGSHVSLALLRADREILIIDNFSNSSPAALDALQSLAGRSISFLQADLAAPADRSKIADAVGAFSPDSAVHLAGLKAVGESVEKPILYYRNNIDATLTLVDVMGEAGARAIVFSSSATVYGESASSPVDEQAHTQPTNPYGRTKFFIEHMLRDHVAVNDGWKLVNLRYFNPVGADPSGQIGEDPRGVPNNLFPYIAQVAVGRREKLHIFGDDYPTPDGTGVRDYIHVCDLADGHVAALDYLAQAGGKVSEDINLGSGRGYSVKEAVSAFAAASGRQVPYEICPRRSGDIAEIFANPAKAAKLLGWKTTRNLDDMCSDHWRWQQANPQGFEGA